MKIGQDFLDILYELIPSQLISFGWKEGENREEKLLILVWHLFCVILSWSFLKIGDF